MNAVNRRAIGLRGSCTRTGQQLGGCERMTSCGVRAPAVGMPRYSRCHSDGEGLGGLVGNVLDPVAAAAVLFDKGPDLRGLVVPRRDGAAGSAGSATDGIEPPAPGPDAIAAFERAFAKLGPTIDLVQT